MEAKIVIQVMEKLIGDFGAIGDSRIDTENFNNLQTLEKVLIHFVREVIEESYNVDSFMASVSCSGEYARDILTSLKEEIDEALA